MLLPSQLIESLSGLPGFDKAAFEDLHASGKQVTSIRINPSKRIELSTTSGRVPWAENGFYLRERPSFTFDPLFHAGCYYVQEASSMFLEQAFKQLPDLSAPLKVLDLSAAPGGKSTHIQSLISPESLLVSNEVIRSRASVLKENIIKWGCANVMVTNNDPADFAALPDYFDVIVVDAPCSGSGLFRREPMAVGEWSPNNVRLCSLRQQRILADIWPALKPGGLLIYSTCSYSKEEDEDNVAWLIKEMGAVYYPLAIQDSWNLADTGAGYRFWPDKIQGEGFFLACVRKPGGGQGTTNRSKNKTEPVSKKELPLLRQWIRSDGLYLLKHQQTVYAWPETHANDFNLLLNRLKVFYSGTILGAIAKDKLIPDHALAMSSLKNVSIPATALDLEEAIRYLQRKDLLTDTRAKGWQLVTYEGHSLGWINVLPNRINNYYPRELRILKDK